jgi:hypothetical protein
MLPDDGELLRSGLDILKQKLATFPSIQTRNVTHFDKRRCRSLEGFKKLEMAMPISSSVTSLMAFLSLGISRN